MTIFTFPIVNSSSLLGSGQTVEMPKMETWESSSASTVYPNFLLDQQVIRRFPPCFPHIYLVCMGSWIACDIVATMLWNMQKSCEVVSSPFSSKGCPIKTVFWGILLRVAGLANDSLAYSNSRVWCPCFHDLIQMIFKGRKINFEC